MSETNLKLLPLTTLITGGASRIGFAAAGRFVDLGPPIEASVHHGERAGDRGRRLQSPVVWRRATIARIASSYPPRYVKSELRRNYGWIR
jgi:hypothetical protein